MPVMILVFALTWGASFGLNLAANHALHGSSAPIPFAQNHGPVAGGMTDGDVRRRAAAPAP